jgi:hypothetical protein
MLKDNTHPNGVRATDIFDTIISQALPADLAAKTKDEPWKHLGLEPGKEIHPASWNLPGNKQVDVIARLGLMDSYGTSSNGAH